MAEVEAFSSIKQEERSSCVCGAKNKDNFEDMDLGSPVSSTIESNQNGRLFPTSSNSLTQILNNLPSSNTSFDIPEFQSPTGSTPGFTSAGNSIGQAAARPGKKRPLSISPLSNSNSSINIDALVRGSPVSLISFIQSQSRNSSAGSFGHLSPSLFSAPPTGHNQYNKPAISLSKAVHPSSFTKNTTDEKSGGGMFHRVDSIEEHVPPGENGLDAVENDHHHGGMKLEFVDIPSDHDQVAYLQTLDQEHTFPDIDEHIELGQTTDYSMMNDFKLNGRTGSHNSVSSSSSSSRVKRIYYAYPAVETPHNNKCMWQGCELQCESLEELVGHVNKEHIYQDSRKDFICQWDGCVREGRAFKAQYMLLVHMRRHTGEKPHKCHVS